MRIPMFCLVLASCPAHQPPDAYPKETVSEFMLRAVDTWQVACNPHDLDLSEAKLASVQVWRTAPTPMLLTAFKVNGQTHFVSCRVQPDCTPSRDPLECVNLTRCCDHTAARMTQH